MNAKWQPLPASTSRCQISWCPKRPGNGSGRSRVKMIGADRVGDAPRHQPGQPADRDRRARAAPRRAAPCSPCRDRSPVESQTGASSHQILNGMPASAIAHAAAEQRPARRSVQGDHRHRRVGARDEEVDRDVVQRPERAEPVAGQRKGMVEGAGRVQQDQRAAVDRERQPLRRARAPGAAAATVPAAARTRPTRWDQALTGSRNRMEVNVARAAHPCRPARPGLGLRLCGSPSSPRSTGRW